MASKKTTNLVPTVKVQASTDAWDENHARGLVIARELAIQTAASEIERHALAMAKIHATLTALGPEAATVGGLTASPVRLASTLARRACKLPYVLKMWSLPTTGWDA